ncbi:TPA: hypothetical protein DCP76_02405 [Patescibacteria group bacterium]|nr:hypothetical protein [Patescibacteria group bacterium]
MVFMRLILEDWNVSANILDLKNSKAAKRTFPKRIRTSGNFKSVATFTESPPNGFFPKLSNILFTSLFIIFLLFL